jgi:ribosomal protein S18 acetylase RimI-like enzyme
MPVRYCEADSADVDQLAQIRSQDWGSVAYWHDRILGYMQGERHPQQALASRLVLIAVEDDRIVGFIAGHLTRRFDCDGEVEWLNVIPERRRTGIAGELLRRLATWFAERDARRICVDVDPDNAPARRFYRKHGAQDLNPHWLVWSNVTTIGRHPDHGGVHA